MTDPLEEISAGKIAPVYFVCGEAFPRDRLVQTLRRAVLDGPGGNDFNFEAFDGKESKPSSILAAVRTAPMLGGKRLVQVRDAHLFTAEQLNELLPYVKDPAPYSCLLLIGDKADLRLKFFNAVKKHGVLQRFEPLKERQVPRWLQQEARRAKIKLAPGVAERIGEAVGVDMGQLAAALERLTLYAGPGKRVTEEHVEEVLAQTRQRSIFELTNAVGRGQRREAMLVLRQMLQAREPGLRIVAMLARHVRQLWQAKELTAQRAGEKAIASQLGIHPFFVKDLLTQAARFDLATLRRTHGALVQVDRTLKSSRLPDALVMDQLVLALCPP